MQVGLFTDIPSQTVSGSINLITTDGYNTPGDNGAGTLVERVPNAAAVTVTLSCDVTDASSRVWRYAKQPLTPEMFGAVGDGVTDDYAAFKRMYELINYWGEGEIRMRPGAEYRIDTVFDYTTGFQTYTITREDGRTADGAFFAPNDANETMYLIGVKGLVIRGNGARITCNGDFTLTASDYNGSVPKLNSMIPLHLWKCEDVLIENLRLNGEWSKMKSEQGGSGQRFGYAVRSVGSKRVTFRNCDFDDFSMDAIVCTHRYEGSVNGITLSDLECFPEPDETTSSVYSPSGLSEKWTFINCRISNCGRQGCSPVGVWDFLWIGGKISSIYVNQSAYPRWQTNDPTGSGNTYQVPPVLPGYCIDFEPDRNGPDQCKNLRFIGAVFENSLGWMGALGDAGRIRTQNSFAASAVNTTTDIITLASNTLPRAIDGQKPQKIRFFSSGTLPGGISPYTDYYIQKLSSMTFQVARTWQDAIDGVFIDLTSQGSGTHYAAVYDSLPCIDRLVFDQCHFHSPYWAGLTPLTGHVPVYRFNNCTFDIEGGLTSLRVGGATARSDIVFEGGRIEAVRQAIQDPSSQELKTLAQATDIDISTDVFTDTNFSTDSDVDGMGRYEFSPVYVFSSGTLPTPLVTGRKYWLTRLTASTFKLSDSEADAIAGVYVNITNAGSGTLTLHRDYGSQTRYKNLEIIGKNRFNAIDAVLDVDVATDTIYSPNHRLSGPSFNGMERPGSTAEPVRLVALPGGALPTGLSAGTSYYPIVVDADHFKLATSTSNANADTAIDITAVGSGSFRLANGLGIYGLVDAEAYTPHWMENCYLFVPKEFHSGSGTETVSTFLRWRELRDLRFDTDLPKGGSMNFRVQYDGSDEYNFKSGLRFNSPRWTSTGLAALSEAYLRTLQTSLSLTPVAVNATTQAEQTFTVAGLKTTDNVQVKALPGATAGLSIKRLRVTAADTLGVTWENATAGSLTPTSGTYVFEVSRTTA